ncbi:hypothetical protein GT755_24940 [Herbidospora sp. NEAU-GS84]|uniref:Uncharacterized protein n=1 Tax=Herbidospora solisilvae TaxID=2696284 RepID=A0A7C9JXL0_9ACTN|nr:hypothetical protein [Herbidospora solisilvae]NAS24919.1 hypothetical protein [Herbidospora solisilvae]
MTRRILAALAVVAAVLLPAVPANAGAWAVTELDTFPQSIEPGATYTIGYWVLQHGTHPFEGPESDMRTGLRLTQGSKVLDFPGTPLPEPAHFAATIQVPEGTWKLEGVQGIFAPYNLGRLTVPGGLEVAPPPFPSQTGGTVTDHWGPVKPPGFPWDAKHVVTAGTTATAPAPVPSQSAAPAPAAASAPAPAARADDGLPWGWAAGGAAMGAVAVFLAGRLRRPRPVPPAGDREDTYVISRG